MKALAIHIDPLTESYLVRGGILIESQPISEPDELNCWVVDELYDALIVDLQASGLGTLFPHILRQKKILMPIIGIERNLSLEQWSEYRAEFLEHGGDDLLYASSNPRELLASIHAVFRRKQGVASEVMSFVAEDLELKIDLTSRDVSVNGSHIPFTKQESDILIRLANRRRSVISREVLLSSLYVHSVDEPEIKLLDVIICKMRKKLKTAHPEANRFIETVRGRGFKLVSGFITGDSRGMAS